MGTGVQTQEPAQMLNDIIKRSENAEQENMRLTEQLEIAKEQIKEVNGKLKQLEIFEDLLDDEGWEYFKLPVIKNKLAWRMFQAFVKQVFGSVTDRYMRAVLEAMIIYCTRTGHRVGIQKEFFSNVGRGDGE